MADEQGTNGVEGALPGAAPITPIAGGLGDLEHASKVLCPYCGLLQAISDRCGRCRGLFDPASRQATQNAMGPWQVYSQTLATAPGLSFERLREMVLRGRITRETVLRGPATRQFWAFACNTQGIAVLLGECHHCHEKVDAAEFLCRSCGAVLTCTTDRQHLGLAPVRSGPGLGGSGGPSPAPVPAPATAAPPVSPAFGASPEPAVIARPPGMTMGAPTASPAPGAAQVEAGRGARAATAGSGAGVLEEATDSPLAVLGASLKGRGSRGEAGRERRNQVKSRQRRGLLTVIAGLLAVAAAIALGAWWGAAEAGRAGAQGQRGAERPGAGASAEGAPGASTGSASETKPAPAEGATGAAPR